MLPVVGVLPFVTRDSYYIHLESYQYHWTMVPAPIRMHLFDPAAFPRRVEEGLNLSMRIVWSK